MTQTDLPLGKLEQEFDSAHQLTPWQIRCGYGRVGREFKLRPFSAGSEARVADAAVEDTDRKIFIQVFAAKTN